MWYDFIEGYQAKNCQWSQIVMWFDVTAAGVVTEAIMWPLSSIQLVALTVTTKLRACDIKTTSILLTSGSF